ncbi:MAG: DnaJ domain-containing protein, partial [Pseudomonadota bacterium]
MGQRRFTDEAREEADGFFSVLKNNDYYTILSVDRNASPDEIKRASFSLIKKFHPDSFRHDELGDYKAYLEKILISISKVYGVLSAPGSRARYNEFLEQQSSIKSIEQETQKLVEKVRVKIESMPEDANGMDSRPSDAPLARRTSRSSLHGLQGLPPEMTRKPKKRRRLISVLGCVPRKSSEDKKPRRSRIDSVMKMANASESQGKLLDALRALEVALEYDPENRDLRDRHSDVSDKVNPELAQKYYNAGCSEEEFGNIDKALESFRKAATLCPDIAEYQYRLANVLLANDRNLHEALSYISAALRIDSK